MRTRWRFCSGQTSARGELEDRSRRDDLIFCGIPDLAPLTEEAISCAHRRGSFTVNKHRPIIVKFSSSKRKQKVFNERKKIKGPGISFSEDFCRATRLPHKKLIKFGKASGQNYALRFNHLLIDKKKTYIYCLVTDRVCKIPTSEPRAMNAVVSGPSDCLSNSQA